MVFLSDWTHSVFIDAYQRRPKIFPEEVRHPVLLGRGEGPLRLVSGAEQGRLQDHPSVALRACQVLSSKGRFVERCFAHRQLHTHGQTRR